MENSSNEQKHTLKESLLAWPSKKTSKTVWGMKRSREFGSGLLAMTGYESIGAKEGVIGVVGMGMFLLGCIHC